MLRFLSISVLVVLLTACSGYRHLTSDAGLESFLSRSPGGLVYKSGFNFKAYYFSGIMVIKPEEESIRIQFLSELGPTIMDFRLLKDKMEVIKMIESLQKKVFMAQMEYDLRLLLQAGIYHQGKAKLMKSERGNAKYKIKGRDNNIFFVNQTSGQIERGFRRGIGYEKVEVAYDYEGQNSVPHTMTLTHNMIDIKLRLSLLN
ncbi:MAG: hypothetical protein HC819_06375 [Cyclobacteriaceae bacterium]|nr:hypothetical protein [Cyclobacteriaceae bacterium]